MGWWFFEIWVSTKFGYPVDNSCHDFVFVINFYNCFCAGYDVVFFIFDYGSYALAQILQKS